MVRNEPYFGSMQSSYIAIPLAKHSPSEMYSKSVVIEPRALACFSYITALAAGPVSKGGLGCIMHGLATSTNSANSSMNNRTNTHIFWLLNWPISPMRHEGFPREQRKMCGRILLRLSRADSLRLDQATCRRHFCHPWCWSES